MSKLTPEARAKGLKVCLDYYAKHGKLPNHKTWRSTERHKKACAENLKKAREAYHKNGTPPELLERLDRIRRNSNTPEAKAKRVVSNRYRLIEKITKPGVVLPKRHPIRREYGLKLDAFKALEALRKAGELTPTFIKRNIGTLSRIKGMELAAEVLVERYGAVEAASERERLDELYVQTQKARAELLEYAAKERKRRKAKMTAKQKANHERLKRLNQPNRRNQPEEPEEAQ